MNVKPFPGHHSKINMWSSSMIIKTIFVLANLRLCLGFTLDGFVGCLDSASAASIPLLDSNAYMADRTCLELCRVDEGTFSVRNQEDCHCSKDTTKPGSSNSTLPTQCGSDLLVMHFLRILLKRTKLVYVMFPRCIRYLPQPC